MKKLPTYLITHNQPEGYRVGCIKTTYPCMVGNVIVGDEYGLQLVERYQKGGIPMVKIDGFQLWVVAGGCLAGGIDDADALEVLNDMAALLRQEVFIGKVGQWRDWCEDREKANRERDALREARREIDMRRKFAKIDRELFGR